MRHTRVTPSSSVRRRTRDTGRRDVYDRRRGGGKLTSHVICRLINCDLVLEEWRLIGIILIFVEVFKIVNVICTDVRLK